MGIVDNDVIMPSYVKPQSCIKRYIERLKRASNTHLFSSACRFIDAEFDKLNALFSLSLEACCDTEGKNKHDLLYFYSENDSFLSHEVVE